MSEDEVPQWKRDLIRKKQSWKTQGGWSVPPLTSRRPLPQIPVRFAFDNPPKSPSRLDNPKMGGSFFDLTSTNDDDVFALSKARSVDNFLNEPPNTDPHVRRVSTSTLPLSTQSPFNVRRRRKIGSTMEDFYKKYVKTPIKTTTTTIQNRETLMTTNTTNYNKTTERRNGGGGEAPVYFYDLNYNELPPPNTVRQTIRAFENNECNKKELAPIRNGTI